MTFFFIFLSIYFSLAQVHCIIFLGLRVNIKYMDGVVQFLYQIPNSSTQTLNVGFPYLSNFHEHLSPNARRLVNFQMWVCVLLDPYFKSNLFSSISNGILTYEIGGQWGYDSHLLHTLYFSFALVYKIFQPPF